ncbi:histidine kinase [Flavobacterium sp.]|uniref:sensor histidine kinase n=1 Tax=Flavobacterium sp. TaxID=239 RepID=UPI0012078C81|nr:histidine kinase [Flavobacterium sp.]RZJ70515.1 MAG: hypothetical protein EOO49_13730 [Flavobacterium sp.]
MKSDIAIGILVSLTFICIIIAFCVILIRLYFTKIKKYTAALYQKDLDLQKAITQTVIETQEQVLQNISQDLHDDAGQQLTYINFQIESLRLDSAQYNVALEPMSEAVQKLSSSIRNLSHALSNQLLITNDLVKAIASEAERLKNTGRIDVAFSVAPGFDKVFDANEKTVIYRIFQESMNNVLKHSKARFVDITLNSNPFEMAISDDGQGFATDAKFGYGLSGMEKRAESIGYRLSVESIPNAGTIIRIIQNQ